jgi:hypothetical protein
MNWFDDKINREFDFLNKSGFKGPIVPESSREIHAIYVKKCLILDIFYNGGYDITLIQTKTIIPGIEENKISFTDIYSKTSRIYKLKTLDFKNELFNSVYFNDQHEKFFWYYRHLLIQNPKILNGNLYKFSLRYRLLRILRLKK